MAGFLFAGEILRYIMKVLLVNPNRFRDPPAPPLGLEYVAGYLESLGHAVKVLDLCFSTDMMKELEGCLSSLEPDMVGISVRNIDSVLFPANEFYLDDIRDMVEFIKSRFMTQIVLGGAGMTADPEGLLRFLGGDCAVAGHAEGVLEKCLDDIQRGGGRGRVYHAGYGGNLSCRRNHRAINYEQYMLSGGIAGFETHRGCSSGCVYCLEADSPVLFRTISDVIGEIRALTERGCRDFHLCDSEFNEDIDHALAFCQALKESKVNIAWTAYMKPANCSRKLIRLMKESGVYLVTLTVDTFDKCPAYWSDVERIIFLAKASGIRIMVDLLTGFPNEDEETLKWCLDLFRRLTPERVNINTYIRLYRSLRITSLIMKDPLLKQCLSGHTEDSACIRPVFYNHVSTERLRELVEGDELLYVEGTDKGVNYRRAFDKCR